MKPETWWWLPFIVGCVLVSLAASCSVFPYRADGRQVFIGFNPQIIVAGITGIILVFLSLIGICSRV